MKNKIPLISWICIIVTIFIVNSTPPLRNIPLKNNFSYFPLRVGEWYGKDRAISAFLNIKDDTADNILMREYENNAGEKLELQLRYFEYTDRDRSPHSFQLCWSAIGWLVENISPKKINLNCEQPPYVLINRLILKRGDVRLLYLYCYKANEVYMLDLAKFRIISMVDSIFKRKRTAFTLNLYSEINEKDALNKEKMIDDFLSHVLTTLQVDFLP
jgi:EpsI family protein